MKKDQVHVFHIDRPLTSALRKAIGQQIEENAKSTSEPVTYLWDEEDDGQLHIDIGPIKLDVVFYEEIVELYTDAPLWARAMISKEKEAALNALVKTVLTNAGLIDATHVDEKQEPA